jgi:hypothetical protein
MMLSPRFKKLVGVLVILVWLPIYIMLGWAIGLHVLPHAGPIPKFLYYAIVGVAWIVPIGLMLPWMSRDGQSRQRKL